MCILCVHVYSNCIVLSCSVWQYIEELTAAKECTVVITTHDVNEARRANTVR